MTISLHNTDNVSLLNRMSFDEKIKCDLLYADCIYDDKSFWWVRPAWRVLKDNGIFIVQTDHHTVFDYYPFLMSLGATFVNHLVWKNEWGNHPKNKFHQCFDDILIFCKGNNWKFFSNTIQVPKATANTKLNPSGRATKTATAWIDDICLTTTAKERVKLVDGHLIPWQKPLELMHRLIAPFTEYQDTVLDPFMGSGTLGVWCKQNDRNYIGIEKDTTIFNIGKQRIDDSWSYGSLRT